MIACLLVSVVFNCVMWYRYSYNYSNHKRYAYNFIGSDYKSTMGGLKYISRDLLEKIIINKSITYREANTFYITFDNLNGAFEDYCADYERMYGSLEFVEIYKEPNFQMSNLSLGTLPIAGFFLEVKTLMGEKEELSLSAEQIEKLKIILDATDKLIEIYDKHYVSFEEPLEDILDSHFHHIKELREYFGGSENNLYKLYE